jgi:membrane-associated phospholipid phosphatase
LYALGLLASLAFVLFAVGRHPLEEAPATTLPFVGTFDLSMYHWMDDIRVAPLTWLFRFLNVVGGGIVTIPLRTAASVVLVLQRRWRAFWGFAVTWASSEILLVVLKGWFHRGRPAAPLVEITGQSFPSGHAVAGAATAVALVLAFMPAGPRRRKWEWIAGGFAFTMAFSRVYLNAHWFSDVVAGVLLGAGIAIGSVAFVTETRDVAMRIRGQPVTDASAEGPSGSSTG